MSLEINIDDNIFVQINIYNFDDEPYQFKTFTNLSRILDCGGHIQNKNMIFGCDFNVIFYSFFEAQEGSLSLAKIEHTLAKII